MPPLVEMKDVYKADGTNVEKQTGMIGNSYEAE